MKLPAGAIDLIDAVEAVRGRADGLEPEVQADYAQYLVVRLSGLVEQVVAIVVTTHADSSPSTVTKFVEHQIRRYNNLRPSRLYEIVNAFDPEWKPNLKASFDDSETAALGSVVTLRNAVAHGDTVTIGLSQLDAYLAEIKSALEKFAALY